MITTQTFRIELIEATGKHDVELFSCNAIYTKEQALEKYTKMRFEQSKKGYFTPMPQKIKIV